MDEMIIDITKILADVMTGRYGTKNRAELISKLQAIINKLS